MKTAATGLVLGVLPTSTDVYSDFHIFFSYLFGALYHKQVDNENHNYVNSTDCELSQKTTVEAWSGTEWLEESVLYNFNCMEIDFYFAVFTVVFILLPGFMRWSQLVNGIFGQHWCHRCQAQLVFSSFSSKGNCQKLPEGEQFHQ